MDELFNRSIAEIEDLHAHQDVETARQRVQLPYFVTKGIEWFGGTTPEARIENNNLLPCITYASPGCEVDIWYEEASLTAHHPVWTTGTPPFGEKGMPPVDWDAGTWLVKVALESAANGGPAVPDGQEELRPVFEAKCRQLLENKR